MQKLRHLAKQKFLYETRRNIHMQILNGMMVETAAKIKDASDLVAFMYDHCVACAEEYTDWTARRAVKEIAKEMLGLEL